VSGRVSAMKQVQVEIDRLFAYMPTLLDHLVATTMDRSLGRRHPRPPPLSLSYHRHARSQLSHERQAPLRPLGGT